MFRRLYISEALSHWDLYVELRHLTHVAERGQLRDVIINLYTKKIHNPSIACASLK